MSYPSQRLIHQLAGALLLLLWLLSAPPVSAELGAADTPQAIEREALDEDMTALQTTESWALLAHQAQLTRRQAALEADLRRQVETLETLRQQLRRVPPDADLDTFLRQLVEALDAFVRADLPFQRDERLARVAQLARLLEQPEARPAEQLRQILRAYQQELDYGRTIEAYEGQLIDQPDQSDDGERPWVTYQHASRRLPLRSNKRAKCSPIGLAPTQTCSGCCASRPPSWSVSCTIR